MCSRFFATLILYLCCAGLAPNWANAAPHADAVTSTDIGAGGRPVGQAWSRSPVYAANGMAATAQPLASQIAIDILKAGGSAVDAAIAANAALGLMEPTGNGIGGDLFAIVWDPKTQQLHGLNASGRSPKSRTLEQLRQQLGGGRPGSRRPHRVQLLQREGRRVRVEDVAHQYALRSRSSPLLLCG